MKKQKQRKRKLKMIMNFEDANFNIKSYFAQPNYSTGNARPCTSSFERLICASFSQIVLIEVYYTAATDN
jgi:hypothetical protein